MRGVLAFIFAAAAAVACAQEARVIRCDFTSQPDGASVAVDGVVRGIAPITLYDLRPGRHHVRFEKNGYEAADDFLALADGRPAQKNAVLSPLKGLLLLTSEPAGCDISAGGLSLGVTPRLITSLDAKDVHRLLLQKPGYQPRPVEIRFSGRTPLVRHETLIVDSGVVEVASDPVGAEVTVNGLPRGRTPVTVRGVPKGRATVTLRKQGYGDETREIALSAGDRQSVFVKLGALPGTMNLTSVPDGARFYVNDVPRGNGPVHLTDLAPGKYVVRVEKDGYATSTRTVTLVNGGSVVEEFRLSNVMGRIEVRTAPVGAQVVLDGAVVGVTRSRAPDTEVSDVFAVENVLEGEHTLVLRLDGYAEAVRHPVVENRKTQSLSVRLKRIFTPNVEIVTDSGTHRGVLVSNTSAGVEVEVSPGISRTFQHGEIRKLNFLK